MICWHLCENETNLVPDIKSLYDRVMDLRERLHEMIDQADEAVLAHLAREFSLDEEPAVSKDIAETIALWEALAEPMDEEAQAQFDEAVKRRPFFGESGFDVQPD